MVQIVLLYMSAWKNSHRKLFQAISLVSLHKQLDRPPKYSRTTVEKLDSARHIAPLNDELSLNLCFLVTSILRFFFSTSEKVKNHHCDNSIICSFFYAARSEMVLSDNSSESSFEGWTKLWRSTFWETWIRKT